MENRIIIVCAVISSEEVESVLQFISRSRQCIPINRHYEYLQWKEHYFRILLSFQCSRLLRSHVFTNLRFRNILFNINNIV